MYYLLSVLAKELKHLLRVLAKVAVPQEPPFPVVNQV